MNGQKPALRKHTTSPDRWVATIGLGVSILLFLVVVVSGLFDAYSSQNSSLRWPIVWQEVATRTTFLLLFGIVVFGYVLYVNVSGRRWPLGSGIKSSDETN